MTEWAVITDPNSSARFFAGGPAGFVGYPYQFEYEPAVFSRDGLSWSRIEVPGLESYQMLSILDDRLLALSIVQTRPTDPVQIDIWVGELAS